MSRHLTRRRASAGVVVTAALSAALLSGGTSALASVAEEPSTAVPIATPDGVVSSYIVNAKHATPGQTRRVENAVEAAEGVIVQSWPQIGVVVAHATSSTFRADVTEAAGSALESVGATRTVPVSEGTPEGVRRRGARARPATRRTPRSPPTATWARSRPSRSPTTRARPSSGTCR